MPITISKPAFFDEKEKKESVLTLTFSGKISDKDIDETLAKISTPNTLIRIDETKSDMNSMKQAYDLMGAREDKDPTVFKIRGWAGLASGMEDKIVAKFGEAARKGPPEWWHAAQKKL